MEKEVRWLLKEKYPHSKKIDAAIRKDIERLKNEEPLDYVIGFTEFLGCKINLSKKPLIPRPETEYWTEKAIKDLRYACEKPLLVQKNYDLRILDLFSGSGCVGVAILKHMEKFLPVGRQAEVVFAEKDKNFLEQIEINCRTNKINKNRCKIIQSDVFDNIKGKFDYIFANPPYISEKRKNKIQKSVLKYEPKKALFAGKDGFLYIRKFLSKAKNHLKPSGKIFMEFDCIQKKQIEKLFTCQNFSKKNLGGQEKLVHKNYQFHKDQYGKWRWVVIGRASYY